MWDSDYHMLTNSSWHWWKLREKLSRIYWKTKVYFEKQRRSWLLVPVQLY